MPSSVSHTTVDSRDAYALSEWWKQVLDYIDIPGDPNELGDDECMIQRRDGGHRLLFVEVPEGKVVKNRLHHDLRPARSTQDEEVARLLALGAHQLADRRGMHGPGSGWVVLADPEGNEFCDLASSTEELIADGSSGWKSPTMDS